MSTDDITDTALLVVADAYIAGAKFENGSNPETATSSRVFNDGKKLTQLRRGASITTRRERAALLWFSENWPEGSVWPASVPRPVLPVAAE